MKTIFFGTSNFAVPILRRLAEDARFEITAVVTQPDKPAGRKGALRKPPVKLEAERLGLPVLQFESVKSDEAFQKLSALRPDIAAVASFGQIIPRRVLDIPKHGCLNVHASLLPAYRGASPIAAAIAAGDSETGISIMLMDELMDHGPILATAVEPIRPNDTTEALEKRLAELGAGMLPDVMAGFAQGSIQPVEQDHAKATKVPLLTREHGRLDWNKTAAELERLVRAYSPWPGTFFELDGKRIKVLEAKAAAGDQGKPGTRIVAEGLPAVVCMEGVLTLTKLQPEGKPPLEGAAFLRGARNWISG